MKAPSGLHKVNSRYTFYTISPSGDSLEFEYDEEESRANEVKHGISFVEAQALWFDHLRVEIPARTIDEPRFLVIGKIGGEHWSAVITYRDDRVRLISVRRSRREEVAIYEG